MTELKDPSPEGTKRLNVNLRQEGFARVQRLAERRGTSITDAVRDALAFLEWLDAETRNGRRIAAVDADNNVLIQYAIPQRP